MLTTTTEAAEWRIIVCKTLFPISLWFSTLKNYGWRKKSYFLIVLSLLNNFSSFSFHVFFYESMTRMSYTLFNLLDFCVVHWHYLHWYYLCSCFMYVNCLRKLCLLSLLILRSLSFNMKYLISLPILLAWWCSHCLVLLFSRKWDIHGTLRETIGWDYFMEVVTHLSLNTWKLM